MKNLYQRIAAVMEDVQYLAKDDTVDTGKGRGYKAITEEKVTSTVRASMMKNGLVMFPIKQETQRIDEAVSRTVTTDERTGATTETTRTNRITNVDVIYRLQNVDDPNDYTEISSSGTGVDTQDKGVGKAMTYAYKYALLRTFAIPTGEDPDKVSSDIYTEKLMGAPSVEDKYKPNVYGKDAAEILREDILKSIYATASANGVDTAGLDEWVMKEKGKTVAELNRAELIGLDKILAAKAAKNKGAAK